MPTQSELIYCYDGSFDGLLCCVFESYENKEIPIDILLPEASHAILFATKSIPTDTQKAKRVLDSIPKKMGVSALNFVQHAFLTCLLQKELHILLFLRLGFRHGRSVMNMLTDDIVNTLFKAVKYLEQESHLFKGFLRFSIINNVLVGEIEPKNYVLPLLVQHFCERYPEERFLIHDKTHGMGLVYQPYQSAVIPIGALELPAVDEEEQTFRELWQLFYDTIAIQGRHNPECRMSHMPKRYWKYMTEFDRIQKNITPKLPSSSVKLLSTSAHEKSKSISCK
ncbi:TIGR03915 family putative DNA repair protein [Sporomusa sp. KB1]|jgi:probable DNA metabolism protein|uniref:TIGR03915 family putative DNA repair protein n=1 Tax=Sporomusa sp. KB1 TaxID=943346 RepID=UPI0011A57574|nr:TIGR03915 family putative DNA repair protein [Sporomusa sp. KB1]TWH52045.1 putative DNA metabolism protein [Sporomusa sp. KB1]